MQNKPNRISWKDYLYLYSLYFKRGKTMSFFYTIMLILCLTIPGVLIESNAKIKGLLQDINSKLPPNRVKLVIPVQEREAQQKGLLTSVFKIQSSKKDNRKYKDFITPDLVEQVKNTPGVSRIVPLYGIDFPMGIVFAIPGSNTPIQTQMIGSGLADTDGKQFIHEKSSIKNFVYKPGQKVPILMSRFILPVLNTIAQNNGVGSFQLTEKDLIGFTIKVFVGKSQLSDSFKNLGNADDKDKKNVSNVDFSDIIECTIVGFVDMDYSIGLAFPQTFLDIYKEKYWANFQPQFYDSLVVDIPFVENEKLQQKFQDMGFLIGSDTGLLNKLSSILQMQQTWFGIFLQLISTVILVFGIIILFFTVLWILQGKTLEFSIYQFFGASAKRVVFLYTSYLLTLNFIAFVLSLGILKIIFSTLGSIISGLKSKVAEEFQSIFDSPALYHFVVIDSIFYIGFVFLMVMSFLFVYRYISKLNDNM